LTVLTWYEWGKDFTVEIGLPMEGGVFHRDDTPVKSPLEALSGWPPIIV
jgi:hypothetical protein